MAMTIRQDDWTKRKAPSIVVFMDRSELKRGLNHNVGSNIQRLAGMHLLAQGDLAIGIGISRQALNNVIKSRSNASATTLKVVANFFGVGLDDLLAEPQECLTAAVRAFEVAPANRRQADKQA